MEWRNDNDVEKKDRSTGGAKTQCFDVSNVSFPFLSEEFFPPPSCCDLWNCCHEIYLLPFYSYSSTIHQFQITFKEPQQQLRVKKSIDQWRGASGEKPTLNYLGWNGADNFKTTFETIFPGLYLIDTSLPHSYTID